jgi:hypothetical protein
MAGHIIIGYVLLIDSQRDSTFNRSAEVYIKCAKAWNAERSAHIREFDATDLNAYKAVIMEQVE